jgi:ribose 5-phosphate isomerase A
MATQDDSAKTRAAAAGSSLVQSGMTVGLGSGTTAALMVGQLALRIDREGLKITGVATSRATAELARRLNIPLRELDDVDVLDLNLDGADEIDPRFRMLKGRGGALLREKIVASASARRVTMITEEKRVDRLGQTSPLPVEVSSFGLAHTAARLGQIAAEATIRRGPDGSLRLTDGGNATIDCRFDPIDDPEALEGRLHEIAGVLSTGLFFGLCDTLIVGTAGAVEIVEAGVAGRRA